MEVHQHTHPDSYRDRKKWSHYFWEFLMLFLAVFCGFLAEYQLEHTIEKNRERQYVKSLVNDLLADTAHLNFIIKNRIQKIIMLDSFKLLLNSSSYKNYGNDIYFFGLKAARRPDIKFVPNNGTMQQLKNAGGLRLIRNRSVVEEITRYDRTVREAELFGDVEEGISQNYRQVAYKFFNTFVFDKMEDNSLHITRSFDNPALLTFTNDDLNRINYTIHGLKSANRGGIRYANRVRDEAIDLLKTLKREYHLK